MHNNIDESTSLFHGTLPKEAKSILTDFLFKGKKVKELTHHLNSYVSFSTDMAIASLFGTIVFEFPQGVENAIKIPYDNPEWFNSNKEIAEFGWRRRYEEIEIQEVIIENEFVIPNELPFNIEEIKVHIVVDPTNPKAELYREEAIRELSQ